MSKPGPKELGARTPFTLRGGVDIPQWGGINLQEDAGGIGDHQFRELINVSHKGTKLIDRPGLTKINTTALDGEVRGVFDPLLNGGLGGDPELQEVTSVSDCTPITGYGSAGSRYFFFGRDPCAAPLNWAIYHYANDQSPKLQKIPLAEEDHNAAYGFSSDGERLWFVTGTFDETAETITVILKVLPSRNFNTRPVEVFRYTIAYTNEDYTGAGLSGQAVFMGDRYIGHSSIVGPVPPGAAEVNILRYDGLAVTLEDTVTFAVPGGDEFYGAAPTVFQEQLIVPICYSRDPTSTDTGYPNTIRKRTSGGTWSTLSLPANVTHFGAHFGRCAVYKDVLYILGFGIKTDVHATSEGGIVLSYDGSSLSVAQTTIVAGSEGVQNSFRCPVVFNGYLYYLHSPSGSTTTVYVGRFDGSSWDNTHKALTSQFSVSALNYVLCLDVYQGNLVAIIASPSGSEVSKLVASPGTSTSGTWTTLTSQTHASSSIIFENAFGEYGFSSAVL